MWTWTCANAGGIVMRRSSAPGQYCCAYDADRERRLIETGSVSAARALLTIVNAQIRDRAAVQLAGLVRAVSLALETCPFSSRWPLERPRPRRTT